MFPVRTLQKDAKVTRLGPNPARFIHLGKSFPELLPMSVGFYQSNGVFYLRIGDTDDKRYVEGAVDIIINSLRFFGINFDESASVWRNRKLRQLHKRRPIYQALQKLCIRRQSISLFPYRRRNCKYKELNRNHQSKIRVSMENGLKP